MMEPLISIQLHRADGIYQPGDLLQCDYQIDAVDRRDLAAVEASVLWYTEGKGGEDLGVHMFERRVPSDTPEGDLRPLRRFSVRMPNSPLSYRGQIVTIQWCVRVRTFLRGGRERVLEYPFQLGMIEAGWSPS